MRTYARTGPNVIDTGTRSSALIVPDTSIVARWYLADEPHRDAALAVRDAIAMGRVDAVAPPHLPIELATALVRAARRGRFAAGSVPDALDALRAFDLETADAIGAAAEAARISLRTGIHPADALFVAIAMERRATLVTADRRLLAAAREVGCDARGLDELGEAPGDV